MDLLDAILECQTIVDLVMIWDVLFSLSLPILLAILNQKVQFTTRKQLFEMKIQCTELRLNDYYVSMIAYSKQDCYYTQLISIFERKKCIWIVSEYMNISCPFRLTFSCNKPKNNNHFIVFVCDSEFIVCGVWPKMPIKSIHFRFEN